MDVLLLAPLRLSASKQILSPAFRPPYVLHGDTRAASIYMDQFIAFTAFHTCFETCALQSQASSQNNSAAGVELELPVSFENVGSRLQMCNS